MMSAFASQNRAPEVMKAGFFNLTHREDVETQLDNYETMWDHLDDRFNGHGPIQLAIPEMLEIYTRYLTTHTSWSSSG